MIVPNLASRPLLNTRPVWLVVAASTALALVFIVLNVVSFLSSSRTLEPRLAYRDRLRAERTGLSSELERMVGELEKVPWRSLVARVSAANVVLREHAFSWPRLLTDIERVMPHEVRLVRIGPSVTAEGVTLSLEVIARNRDAMLELLENLITDASFSDPIPLREVLPAGSVTAGYDLSLRVSYHPPEVRP